VAGKRRAQRQAEEQQAAADQDARISQLEQQQAAPPAAPAPDRQPSTAAGPAAPSISDQLSDIKRLHDQGILTDEEFSAAKAKVLGI
jgi:hypothetical protein